MNVRKEKRQGVGGVNYFRTFFISITLSNYHIDSLSFMNEDTDLVLSTKLRV